FLISGGRKELKTSVKGTHIFTRWSKKPHKNNAVRFTCVLAAGTTCWVICILKQWLAVFICEKGTQKEAIRNSFS
ncbi:MAG: hypothetical protein EBW83_11570, partial [Rhodobacterales bacterium]|nr:hypothetical protein [Rhodobacterales bacterium]